MQAKAWSHAAVAALVAFSFAGAARATPLQDCALSAAPIECLDAKLKAANRKLNVALKAAQEKLEQLQAKGRRPVLGAFIDSQRKFNAYRDSQCNWQGVRAPSPATSAEYVKDCQIRATLAREQELAEFAAGDDAVVAAAPQEPPDEAKAPPPAPVPDEGGAQAGESPAAKPAAPESPPAAPPPDSASAAMDAPDNAPRVNEWRLVRWIANGETRALMPDSTVTIAFDPSGKVSGKASVNRYTGTYHFDVDGRLRWQPGGFALTRMAGMPPLMAQERAFLDSLRRTSLYRADGQTLILESPNASTVLTFTR